MIRGYEDVSDTNRDRRLLGAQRSDPTGPTQVVLCLQGGGALSAFQLGVYEALVRVDLEPTWILGVSAGALNGAVIAGNKPSERLRQLERLWTLWRSPWDLPAVGIQSRRMQRVSQEMDGFLTIFGKPNFFFPRID